MKIFWGCLSLCIFVAGASVHPPLTVTTDDGPVTGYKKLFGKVSNYFGIPFAKPPVGDMRLKSPERPVPWTTPIKANNHHAGGCPQLDPIKGFMVGSEDCELRQRS